MSTYEVPALTRREVAARRGRESRPADCPQCQTGTPVPHWPVPSICNSTFRVDDSGNEVLVRVHCTCDWCF